MYTQVSLLVISGSLTSLDSVHTLPTRTYFVIGHWRSWLDFTPYHGLAGNWNQDEESCKLHSIPDWRQKEPALGVCMAGRDLIGLQKKEVRITLLFRAHYIQ